jgi:uncharacterized protein YjiS (DUF1127 family)
MFQSLIKAYRKNSLYRSTYNALYSLTNHELKDLGLHRSMLESVAREAAYGKEEPFKYNFSSKFFKAKTEKDKIADYLAESADTIDLENRIKNVDRGLAPWQIQAKHFAQGWAQ